MRTRLKAASQASSICFTPQKTSCQELAPCKGLTVSKRSIKTRFVPASLSISFARLQISPDLGQDYLDSYREMRANLTHSDLCAHSRYEYARANLASGEDGRLLFHRTFLPDNTYTAPVEIDVYGTKVALIAFGDTQMATNNRQPAYRRSDAVVLRLLSSRLLAHLVLLVVETTRL